MCDELAPRQRLTRKRGTAREFALELDEFAWQEIERESRDQGVPVEELIAFAMLYYLADRDSGRISRSLRRGPFAP